MKCNNCGSENIKTIPAGVSKKTGRPYKAFNKCQDCNQTVFPPREQLPPQRKDDVMHAIRELYTLTKKIESKIEQLGIGMDKLILGDEKDDSINPDGIPF